MDFGLTELIRKVVYVAKFVRGQEYLFDAVMFAGTNGVYTGMKNGAFSISENIRKATTDNSIFHIAYNIALYIGGY